MSNPTDGKFVTSISEQQTLEYFSEGLKQAASAAKQLALAQNAPIWARIAITCMDLRLAGLKLAHAKSISRQKTLQILDDREKIMSYKLEEGRPKKFIMN